MTGTSWFPIARYCGSIDDLRMNEAETEKNSDSLERPVESLLLAFMESLLYFFAANTAIYHLWLLLNLKVSGFLWVIPLTLVPVAIVISRRRALWKRSWNASEEGKFLAAVCLLGLVTGYSVLVFGHERGDDVQYFHRGVLQARSLDRPFVKTIELYEIRGMPESAVAFLPSYEPLTGVAAALFGADPLGVFHNWIPVLWSVAWLVSYLLIYRKMGLSRALSVAATVAAYLFLFLDSNLHRSFGAATFIKLGHGKAVVWSVLVPLVILFGFRFFERPSLERWLPCLALTLCGLGFSGSGLFLIPGMLLVVSVACVIEGRSSKASWIRAVQLNLASIYSVAVVLMMLTGVLRNYDLPGYFVSYPNSWTSNLGLVIEKTEILRDVAILLLLPLVSLRARWAARLMVVSATVGALYLNPWFGPSLLKALTAGAYWRLAYMLPLPLCAGLLVSVGNLAHGRRKVLSIAVGGVILLLIASNVERTVVDVPSAFIKRPSEYRFNVDELNLVNAIREDVAGRHLLVPHGVVHLLPLLDPEVELEATRIGQTEVDFDKAGRAEEGRRRALAQRLITKCQLRPDAKAAFRQSVANGVDAVMVRQCTGKNLGRLIDFIETTGAWSEEYRGQGHIMLLREDEKPVLSAKDGGED